MAAGRPLASGGPAAPAAPAKSGALYEVREVDQKGRGLVAARDIRLGELILDELPLVVGRPGAWLIWGLCAALLAATWLAFGGLSWPGWRGWALLAVAAYPGDLSLNGIVSHSLSGLHICRCLRLLGDEQRRQFYELKSGLPYYVPVLSEARIFKRNAVSDDVVGCVCAAASVINHSCVPNACFSWQPDAGRHQVHALKAIARGEEIVASYIDLWHPCELRKSTLQGSLCFVCACPVCSLPGMQRRASDRRRLLCGRLEEGVGAKLAEGRAREALRDLRTLREAVQAELGAEENLIVQGMDETIAELENSVAGGGDAAGGGAIERCGQKVGTG